MLLSTPLLRSPPLEIRRAFPPLVSVTSSQGDVTNPWAVRSSSPTKPAAPAEGRVQQSQRAGSFRSSPFICACAPRKIEGGGGGHWSFGSVNVGRSPFEPPRHIRTTPNTATSAPSASKGAMVVLGSPPWPFSAATGLRGISGFSARDASHAASGGGGESSDATRWYSLDVHRRSASVEFSRSLSISQRSK